MLTKVLLALPLLLVAQAQSTADSFARGEDDLAQKGLPSPPPTVIDEIADMIKFAIDNPEKSQVPLSHRDVISQEEWEATPANEQAALQAKFRSTLTTD